MVPIFESMILEALVVNQEEVVSVLIMEAVVVVEEKQNLRVKDHWEVDWT